ncbi:deoxynucleoside triphosphate triphosphohydrolase SAMHD1-like [Ischnura elegans]|uniref:deoxynucleoside triphosphate triphosphohydrolase SAMHD1-like n=1 Tax=Ischnura elegans TaxID=197161 RepID=UPI001ED8BDC4|nr:deoxynucleoside triphosphate triphosphohydrolase SAMHD1-like [Ischnura elegans]XP_046390257.1 deoxynucleoside triphosphate triphosphohydrolase SAMHD1-like [Ischnura elegans]
METKSSAKEMEFKVFNDSVHGHMEMHPLCVKIIDTPEFQRLRNIKQVGLTYLVYPGAAHNRFEHSLGVCYLAGEMVEALKKNQPDLNINEVDKLCVQIAGLCHDIGHGPFSHLWENFLKQKGLKWHHEDQSVVMFNHLLEKNDLIGEFEKYGLHECERRFITELILGKGDSCDQGKEFLFQIVCNQTNSIDVDKWDYLMRDGLHLNLKVSFDYQRVLKFCRVIEKEECGKKTLHIGFRNKEAYNLYEMFVVRATLHYRAYQHRVVVLLTQMVVDAFLAADDHFIFKLDGNIVYKLSQAHEKPEIWTNLTDNIFYEILGSYTNELATAKDILNLILRRKLYKFIASINVVPSEYFKLQNKFWMDSVQKKLENKLNSETSCGNNSNRYLILFSSFYLGSNCPEPFRHVYFYDKDNPNRGVEKDWKDIALFPICQETAHHVEFYLFDKEQNGSIAEEAEAKCVFEKYMGSIMNGGVYNGS